MKQLIGVGIGIAIGTIIGGAAVTGLHAQGKSPIYVVAEIDVTNAQGFAKEFVTKVEATITKAGGRAVARGGMGGGGAMQVVALEGTPPKRVAIVRWESMDAMKKWWNGAEYKAAREIGNKYAKFRIYAVGGLNSGH